MGLRLWEAAGVSLIALARGRGFSLFQRRFIVSVAVVGLAVLPTAGAFARDGGLAGQPDRRSTQPGKASAASMAGVQGTSARASALRRKASASLLRATQLRATRDPQAGRLLTPALLDLARRYPLLSGAERKRALGLLARPSMGSADPQGFGYKVAEHKPHCTDNFCIHWVTTGKDAPNLRDRNGKADGDGVPDYVELMAQTMEFVHAQETSLLAGGLGWTLPKSDGVLGGSARTDVFIKELGVALYGLCAIDPTTVGPNSAASYLVMDDNYQGLESGNPATATKALQVTAAHEYAHVLQNSYDYLQDLWMAESSAVWVEEQVYPAINDYAQYLDAFISNMDTPLTKFPSSGTASLKPYGSIVWNQWVSSRRGVGALRTAWAASTTTSTSDFAPEAYDAGIRAHGGSGLFDEFTRFSAALAEWRSLTANFPDAANFPDVPRSGGQLTVATPRGATLDHTTAMLFDIPLTEGPGGSIRATTTFPAGVAGAVAIVGRRTDGTVHVALGQAASGGEASATFNNDGGYQRLTAVAVNASVVKTAFDEGLNDWLFSHDDIAVTVTLTVGATVAADAVAPLSPGLVSNALSPTGWAQPGAIESTIVAAFDDMSALQGYSVTWDQTSNSDPSGVVNTGSTTVTSPVLGAGVHYLHASAVDASGNASGPVHLPLRIDATAPNRASMAAGPFKPHFMLGTSTNLSWLAADGESGIGTYDVQQRTAKVGAGFSGFTAARATRYTKRPFNLLPGREMCFRARATNTAGLSGRYGTERCLATPLDERALRRSGTWKAARAAKLYMSTSLTATSAGAALSTGRVQTKTISLVASRCRTCGTVRVYFNGRLLRSISLRGRAAKQQVILVKRFPGARTGRIRVESAGGGPVTIEGLGVRRR